MSAPPVPPRPSLESRRNASLPPPVPPLPPDFRSSPLPAPTPHRFDPNVMNDHHLGQSLETNHSFRLLSLSTIKLIHHLNLNLHKLGTLGTLHSHLLRQLSRLRLRLLRLLLLYFTPQITAIIFLHLLRFRTLSIAHLLSAPCLLTPPARPSLHPNVHLVPLHSSHPYPQFRL
jgi:hypothetical protein